MDLIDSKYISLISSSLQKFKRVKSNLYNFRCPICGDSQRNKNKARGYIYEVKNNANFKCHNCGSSLSFSNFLQKINPQMHKEYSLEKFKEGKTGKNFVVKSPQFEFKKPDFSKKIVKKKLLDIQKASENEKAKAYLESRKLNSDKFYYVDNFKSWVNSIKKSFDDVKYDEPRIVIPLVYENKLIGIQGRSINPSSVKYITIMLDEEAPKIYGFDRIDKELPVYVVEGPFDSTFIDNCVAMCGSDGDVDCLKGSDIIFVYDNEPRNKEIVRRIGNTIDRGFKVVIWPKGIQEKDINDMAISGHQVSDVLKLNTYSGLEAKIKFNNWKKV